MSLIDAIGRGPKARRPRPLSGDALPPDAPRGRRAADILAGEALAEFRHYVQTSTVAMARLAGQVINDVLEVRTVVFTANPGGTYYTSQAKVAAGSIEVENLGSHPVTVVAAGVSADGVAPTSGLSVRIVPAGACRVVSLASRQWTVYGTAGDSISVQVFTRAALGGVGLGAVDGGSP